MTETATKTQREFVLRLLARRPRCGTELLAAYIPRYSARIYELRKEGHQIDRRTCDIASHYHHTRQWIYELAA